MILHKTTCALDIWKSGTVHALTTYATRHLPNNTNLVSPDTFQDWFQTCVAPDFFFWKGQHSVKLDVTWFPVLLLCLCARQQRNRRLVAHRTLRQTHLIGVFVLSSSLWGVPLQESVVVLLPRQVLGTLPNLVRSWPDLLLVLRLWFRRTQTSAINQCHQLLQKLHRRNHASCFWSLIGWLEELPSSLLVLAPLLYSSVVRKPQLDSPNAWVLFRHAYLPLRCLSWTLSHVVMDFQNILKTQEKSWIYIMPGPSGKFCHKQGQRCAPFVLLLFASGVHCTAPA